MTGRVKLEMKTFEKLWEEVWKDTRLPSEAKKLLPQSMSEKTKNRLLQSRLNHVEIALIVEAVVDQINHGSIESIDKLVMSATTNCMNKGK